MHAESEYTKGSFLESVKARLNILHSYLMYELALEQLYSQTMSSEYISILPISSTMGTSALVKFGANFFRDSNTTILRYR